MKNLEILNYTENVSESLVCEVNIPLYFPKVEKKDVKKTINVLSLFSGCGGMDLGFEGGFNVHKDSVNTETNPDFIDSKIDKDLVKLKKTKFKIVFSNDILKEAKTSWIHNFAKLGYNSDVFHSESIVDLVKMHHLGIKVFPENVDIVTGGFPCQDFSIAGKRNGFNSHKDHNGKIIENEIPSEETRGKLYMWMREVINITKPKIFIAENVKGLVNLSDVKAIIQNDFSTAGENGYIVLEPQILHAANYGVPQSRERIIFIGIKKSVLKEIAIQELSKTKISDEFNPYPKPSHSFRIKDSSLKKHQTLENIFSLIDEPEISEDFSQKFFSKAKFMGKHCQGQTEINIKSISPTIRAEHHGNIEYRRLSIDNGGKNIAEIESGLAERRLTPRECGLIQTFPLDFEFVIPKDKNNNQFLLSPSGAYKVIGNAVPPLLAYHIAKRIEKLWNVYFK